ncbi:MAG: GNAT family N-acetyltransferase [Clostridiales bacterium]|jgi:GNAT superfamily N-acetyltransferase|nr:GNAT family N-acetyltransferase [Clostridiales bacterium]
MDEIKKTTSEFIEMRALWCEVFEDTEDYVDAFFECWGDSAEAYILTDSDTSEIKAAATMLDMGELIVPSSCIVNASAGHTPAPIIKPCYVSYAIYTNPELRSKGYGSAITEHIRELAFERGGVSMLCPAQPSLIKFYQPLGYEPRFYATARTLNLNGAFFDISALESHEVDKIDINEYAILREQMLEDTVHIKLSDAAMKFIDLSSKEFVASCNNKVIAVIDSIHEDSIFFSEVLAADDLPIEQIEAALAVIAKVYGKSQLAYRSPGSEYLQTGRLGAEFVQAMIAGDIASEGGFKFTHGYFGFPFD